MSAAAPTSSPISSRRRARLYGLAAPIAVGFSNGANIAAAMLLLRPEALAGAVLLRAMVPLADTPAADLAGKPVLMLSGSMGSDGTAPPTPPASPRSLKEAGANVEHRTLRAGHNLSQPEVTLAMGLDRPPVTESWPPRC